MESQIVIANLDTPLDQDTLDRLLTQLENGYVLHVPHMPFVVSEEERAFLDPAHAEKGRKNISLPPDGNQLIGVAPTSPAHPVLLGLVARYSAAARQWIDQLFPHYRQALQAAPTSLRLHRVETRDTSWRKDDSRLHVDAFPSRPNQGRRILRVFMNINPQGEPRVWRVGEPFETVARRFLPAIPAHRPALAWLQQALHITKSYRSDYDHIMLHLHDAMKADMDYQRNCRQEPIPFAAGAGWICYSDHASHAVMSGQFMLEQTFFLAPSDMADPHAAPIAQLERLTQRALI